MQCSRLGVLQYLVKECLKVTGLQLQSSHLIWKCTIQMVKPLVIVFKCYVLV